ncbi:MAG: DUF4147 domain-containing protein [Candidatus Thermoplasmatota archaeon]|nr:DUF4147 domain-containing protein [Candidatus Thermoplasmatota archaeon]MCL5963813.1 DUF4147 domain-containing protein [Candidatus Thermoplasmatota archaeon]
MAIDFENVKDLEKRFGKDGYSLIALLEDGFKLVNGYESVKNAIKIDENRLKIGNKIFLTDKYRKINVISVGYSANSMCRSVIDLLPDLIGNVLCISPFKENIDIKNCEHIYVLESEWYTDKVISSAERILEFLKNIMNKDEILLLLISSKADKLADIPADGLSMGTMKEIMETLTTNGAPEDEINLIHRSLSKFYTELFRKYIDEEKTVALVISNIPSGSISLVSSGLTFNVNYSKDVIIHLLKKYNYKKPELFLDKIIVNQTRKNITNTRITGLAELFIVLKEEFADSNVSYYPITSNYQDGASNVGSMVSAIINSSAAYGFPAKKPFVIAIGGNYTLNNGFKGKHGIIVSTVISRLNIPEAHILSLSTSGKDGYLNYGGILVNSSMFHKKENHLKLENSIMDNRIDELFEDLGCTIKLKSDLDIGDLTMIFVK